MEWTEKALMGEEAPDTYTVGDLTSSCISWNGSSICFGYTVTDFINGVDKKLVGKVSRGNFDNVSKLMDFQMDVTCVDVSENLVIAGASDYSLKIIKLDAPGELGRAELDGEPLSVKIDPLEKFVAVTSLDGDLSIFSIEPFELITSQKKVFPNFGVIDVTHPLVNLCWARDGSEIFVPGKGVIKSFKRDTWNMGEHFLLKGAETISFSTCSVSVCGTYVASSTMTNKIAVWRINGRESVFSADYNRKLVQTFITSLEFSPFNCCDLIIADSNEGICILQDVCKNETVAENLENVDEDDEIVVGRHRKKNPFIDDEVGDNENFDDDESRLSAGSDIGKIKKKYGFDNVGMNELEEYGFGGDSRTGDDREASEFSKFTAPKYAPAPPVPKIKPIPERFVSGSTPVHLAQRYLKWNCYGMVRSFVDKVAKTSSIEIEFHDATIHPEIVRDNFETNYQLADISNVAVALASVEDKEKERKQKKDEELEEHELKGTSELLVIYVDSWDLESKEWKVTLPKGDGAVDVLVSRTLIAVITRRRNIRVFTLTGTQRQIVAHPGPILTAAVFQNKVAVASVSGPEFYEEEHKKVAQHKHVLHVYEMDSKTWYRNTTTHNTNGGLTTCELPISAGESLFWLSYTAKGNIVVMDSDYVLSMRSACGIWVPIFDGSTVVRSQSDSLWPISVVEMPLRKLRYIYCRGAKYPIVSLGATPKTADWSLSFCNPESDKTKLEEELFLNELGQADAMLAEEIHRLDELQKAHLATIVKMFALACKSDRDSRAAELATLVSSSKGIQMLCNYANRNHKTALSEKVAAIGRDNVLVSSKNFAEASATSGLTANTLRPTGRINVNAHRNRMSNVLKTSTTNSSYRMSALEDDDGVSSVSTFVTSQESRIVRVDADTEDVNDNDDDELVPDSQMSTSICDTTLNMSAHIPLERETRNPFKRDSAVGSRVDASMSVFDQLEMPLDSRKRGREEDPSNRSAKRQSKLAFNSPACPTSANKDKDKENLNVAKSNSLDTQQSETKTATPYSLWLEAKEATLRSRFSGDSADFTKFCVQSFRTLSANEKKEWKTRAETARADE